MNNRIKQLFSVPVGIAIWWVGLIIIILAFGAYVGITREDNVSFSDGVSYDKYASKVKEVYQLMGMCKGDQQKDSSVVNCWLFIDKHFNSLKYAPTNEVVDKIEKQGEWKDISPRVLREMNREIGEFIISFNKGEKVEM